MRTQGLRSRRACAGFTTFEIALASSSPLPACLKLHQVLRRAPYAVAGTDALLLAEGDISTGATPLAQAEDDAGTLATPERSLPPSERAILISQEQRLSDLLEDPAGELTFVLQRTGARDRAAADLLRAPVVGWRRSFRSITLRTRSWSDQPGELLPALGNTECERRS